MKKCVKVLAVAGITIGVLLLGVCLGSVSISISDILTVLGNKLFGLALPEGFSQVTVSILWTIRFPRVVMAFLAGAALAASGTVMQSILRNPLASPHTLGVSSGASLMAAIVIVTGLTIPVVNGYTLPLLGFLGGLISVLLSMRITVKLDRNLQSHTIILVGMVLSLFVNAMLTLITALSADSLNRLVFWQMGGFSGQKWLNCAMLLPVLMIGLAVLLKNAREMDLMTFGEEQALSAGVDLKRVKLLLIIMAALLTGTTVSFVGVIGFIDLIAPHVIRKLFGSKHQIVVPMSALFGGVFMVVCDLVARTVLSPQELPVGAVTALVGAPFFVYIYFRKEGGVS